MNNEVMFIRMDTGEDLIAYVSYVEDNDYHYYLMKKPMKIAYIMNTDKNSFYITLIQWIFSRVCDEQTFRVNPTKIITMCPPSEDMKKYYEDGFNDKDDDKDNDQEVIFDGEPDDIFDGDLSDKGNDSFEEHLKDDLLTKLIYEHYKDKDTKH